MKKICHLILVYVVLFAMNMIFTDFTKAQDDILITYDKVYTQVFHGEETIYFQFEGNEDDVVVVQAISVECCGIAKDIKMTDSAGREVGISSKNGLDPFVIADLRDADTYFIAVTAGVKDKDVEYLILLAQTAYLMEGQPISVVHDAEMFDVLFLINPAQTQRYTLSYSVTTEIAPDFKVVTSEQYPEWLFNVNAVSPFTQGTVTLELERFGMYVGVVFDFGRSRGIGEMTISIEAAN